MDSWTGASLLYRTHICAHAHPASLQHGTCPACRHVFLDIKPVSESDNESSDDDYIPGDDYEDDEEDLEFTDDDESVFSLDLDPSGLDEFVDAEEEIVGDDEADGDSMRNWGLSDGDSLSDGELSFNADDGADVEMDGKQLILRCPSSNRDDSWRVTDILLQEDKDSTESLEDMHGSK